MTLDQADTLRALIASDPQLAGLASEAQDTELAERLNAKTLDGNVLVSTAEVKRQAILQGYFGDIVLASRGEPSAVASAAIAAVGYVDDPRFQAMDLSLPAVRVMINTLVAGNLMSKEQADALTAMGRGKISLAEQICGSGTVITSTEVGELR